MLAARRSLHATPSLRRWLAPQAIIKCRRIFTTPPPYEPVNLAYDLWGPNGVQSKRDPILILHGLFGSKRNWHSLGKAFAKNLQRPVYTLDLRNHGDSPHDDTMDYITMSTDIIHFCDEHSLENTILMGHSLGGKVAMTLALRPDLPSHLLSRLVVGDISPVRGKIAPDFQRYIEGMREVERQGVRTRKEADEILTQFAEDAVTRAFLLTNVADAKEGSTLTFRVPLDIISRSVPDIGDFPYLPGEISWDGPTLFMKGSDSNYIQEQHKDTIRSFFPNMRFEELQASHWLHAEKPSDFLEVVSEFCNQS